MVKAYFWREYSNQLKLYVFSWSCGGEGGRSTPPAPSLAPLCFECFALFIYFRKSFSDETIIMFLKQL